MREVGDAARVADPAHHLGEGRELAARELRIGVEAEREHVRVVLGPPACAFSSVPGITSSRSVERSTVRAQWSVIASTSNPAQS